MIIDLDVLGERNPPNISGKSFLVEVMVGFLDCTMIVSKYSMVGNIGQDSLSKRALDCVLASVQTGRSSVLRHSLSHSL